MKSRWFFPFVTTAICLVTFHTCISLVVHLLPSLPVALLQLHPYVVIKIMLLNSFYKRICLSESLQWLFIKSPNTSGCVHLYITSPTTVLLNAHKGLQTVDLGYIGWLCDKSQGQDSNSLGRSLKIKVIIYYSLTCCGFRWWHFPIRYLRPEIYQYYWHRSLQKM